VLGKGALSKIKFLPADGCRPSPERRSNSGAAMPTGPAAIKPAFRRDELIRINVAQLASD
jgi:hypothetical protein